jgi:hypothetical protein
MRIGNVYCKPFLIAVNHGSTPSTCNLYTCAAQVRDGLGASLSPNDLARGVNYLAECVSQADTSSPTALVACRGTALAMLKSQAERGAVAPSGALTILGDRADRVRCAYAACPQFVRDCFADDLDGGGFPTVPGTVDSCLAYRLCLAGCRQNVADPSRRSRCVFEQCDALYANGKRQFMAYRDCMMAQPPTCGQDPRPDGGPDAL